MEMDPHTPPKPGLQIMSSESHLKFSNENCDKKFEGLSRK